MNGLERIIKYGQVYQTQSQNTSNTLFGDLSESMEIQTPKLPDCEPWPLVIHLDNEKEVTGIFISGHPLDDYRFEMEHYGISKIGFVNGFKDDKEKVNSNATFKIMGLVSDAQHRVAKSGNKFGSFVIEDYSGKLELVLFSEDYLKHSAILQLGATVYITGFFKQRFNGDFDFKISSICLAESVKKNFTKRLSLQLPATDITEDMIAFVQQNLKNNKGPSTLNFMIRDEDEDIAVELLTNGKGFEMNNELIQFLSDKENWKVKVEYN
nr:OB-fold nucleic acid binding domain-containing protein [Niabella ginsengisoli]